MAFLGVPTMPTMSLTSVIAMERAIGDWWRQQLEESMKEAGREERRLATENNEYHEVVPEITVVIDGGWSKRSLLQCKIWGGCNHWDYEHTSSCTLVYVTKNVQDAKEGSKNTTVSKTGTTVHRQWRLT